VNGDSGLPQFSKSLKIGEIDCDYSGSFIFVNRSPVVLASEVPLSCHIVMLNLFQHLSFQCINLEIPKQVRNDRESSPIVIASPDLSGRGNLSVLPPLP